MKKMKQLFFVVQVFCVAAQNVKASRYTGMGNSSLPFTCAEENSCKNRARCGAVLETQRGKNSAPKCFCDSHCSSLNDCCADLEPSCQTNNQTNKIANTHLTTNTWRCYQYSKIPRSPGIWMIATCPVNYTDNPVPRAKCEDAANIPLTSSSVDFLSNVPTTHCYKPDGCVTFRNYYCARCNGILAPIFWKLTWRCNISPPKHLNNTERDKFLMEYCPDSRLEPHDTTARRYCYGVVSTCSAKGDSFLRNDCIRGPARLVYHPKTDKHYKNPSCLMCNGLELDSAICGPSEFSSQVFQPKSFEMVLQFETFPWNREVKSTMTQTSCGKEMVYDEFLEECRRGVLPDPVQSIVDKFRFKMWLKPVLLDTLTVDKDVFKRAILEKFSLPSRGVSLISLKKEEKSIAAILDVQAISTNSSFNTSSSAFGLKKLLRFSDPFELLIRGKTWNVFKVTHKRLACSKPKIYPPGNFTRFNESSFLVNNETLVAAEDGQIIARNHSDQNIQAGSLFVCTSFFTEICNTSQVLLALKEEDYTLVNETVYFKAADQSYPPGSYEMQGKTAWVCTDYKNHTNPKILKSNKQTKRSENKILWYFTVCGFSFSIVSLVFLLGTYVVFKELRTLPGKNMMSLSLSLLLSEFMWLLGSGDTDNPGFCKTTALLLHYLFLASFACMTVIAHDTRRAFPKNNAQMSNHLFPSSQRRLMMYLLFSWGLPLVFVVTCFLLDQQGAVAIGYGNPVICWLTDLKAQIIIFGVPVGVMLLYNLVAFIQTVQSIRVARIGSKTLHRQGGNHGNDCKIYLRLMTLMGFTWFFGFGAHALHESLMYVFVLLTSLQGVYLALAFAVKPHVFGLYRNRLASLSISRKTTISTLDLTSSMKSTPSRSAESVI